MQDPQFKNLDQLASYQKLSVQKGPAASDFLRTNLNAARVQKYQTNYSLGNGDNGQENLSFNYAATSVDDAVLSSLASLANEAELTAKFQALAAGAWMNTGEKRMVLHHLSRGQLSSPVSHEGRDLGAFYKSQHQKAADFALSVHSGKICGTSQRQFTTVVQIGIGGSDLGPRALYLALLNYVQASERQQIRGRGQRMEARFISNVDPDDAADVLRDLDAETTLFILVSKSGVTLETLTNETLVIEWLKKNGIKQPKKHIACVTSETSPLAKSADYLASFFIDDFIGGRFSATSPCGGLVLSLAFGPDVFAELLAGAHAADLQATEKDILKNPAMLDAAIGVYQRNVLGYPCTAILPYSQALSRFPAHLQQADMESNGKSVNRLGQSINYATGPVLFGEPGTNGQHSFFQLLHQGTDIVPLQFMGFKQSQDGLDVLCQNSTSQKKLNANLAAQIIAFALGNDNENPNKQFNGRRPSTLLLADRLSPRTLGALLAHYENKIMFQGFLWNLNSFDQEGVQLGKVLATKVLDGKTDGALKAFATLLNI